MGEQPYLEGKKYQKVFTEITPFAVIIDDYSTVNITYFCYADCGSSTGDAVWKIKVIDETGNYPLFLWADGDSKFDNIADNRTSLSYS